MPLDETRFAGFRRHRDPRAVDDERLEPVARTIEHFGWHCQEVMPDPGRIGWTYTVGFADTFDQPDLLVSGLPGERAVPLLNALGDAIAEGTEFDDFEPYTGFLDDRTITFAPVQERWLGAHVGLARRWYGEWPAVRQILVPDEENRLPDEPFSDADQFQLLLHRSAPAPRRLTHPHLPVEVPDPTVVVVPDSVGRHPTGWLEEVQATPGLDDRFVVASVPFVPGLCFGDEIETELVGDERRIVRVTDREPVATVRMPILKGGPEVRDRLAEVIDAVNDDSSTVWESPVPEWLFFGVAHERFEWFRALVRPLGRDGIVGVQVERGPEPDSIDEEHTGSV